MIQPAVLLDVTNGTALSALVEHGTFRSPVNPADTSLKDDPYKVFYIETVDQVARGMRALAAARPGSLHSSVLRVQRFPDRETGEPFSARYGFAMENEYRGEPSCWNNGEERSPWSRVWSESGLVLFGMKLECEHPFQDQFTNLTLALPTWDRANDANTKPYIVTLITIHLNGIVFAERRSLRIKTREGYRPVLDPQLATKHLFGIESLGDRNVVLDNIQSGNVEQILGFPEAEALLIAQLPLLGPYLVSLADQATLHTH